MPAPPTGGLSISDSAIKFMEIKGGKEFTNSLRLPPGIIEFGKVKNQKEFVAALKKLHQLIDPDPSKIINTVLTIPASDTYNQVFSLSRYAETGLAEAAELNLRMLSPINIDDSYYGWQKVGESSSEGGQIELLGAVAFKNIINEMTDSLQVAGFGIAAVEFCSLSLVRSINSFGLLDKKISYLVIEVNAEGLDFVVIRNNNLYFNYFYPWNLVQGDGRNVSLESMQSVIQTEINKILSFYFTHWGESIKNLFVITPVFGEEISSVVCKKCAVCENKVLNPGQVNSERGAALRGLISRTNDFEINLTNVNASGVFGQEQIIYFIKIWRNILFSVFGFLLLVFVASNLYINQIAENEALHLTLKSQNEKEFNELQARVVEFNKLVGFVKKAKKADDIYPFLDKLNELAGSEILFNRIYFPPVGQQTSMVNASTAVSSDVEKFVNKLRGVTQFGGVTSLITDTNRTADGRYNFSVRFLVKSLSDLKPSKENVPNNPSVVPDNSADSVIPPPSTVDLQGQKTLEEGLGKVTEQLSALNPKSVGPIVTFEKIYYKSKSIPIRVTTSTPNRDTMVLFKNKLEESPYFRSVKIIDSSITDLPNGRVRFDIEFFIKN
jgi:hypothetical protein